jgi:DNA integrity scanning protein DisA with diadenylate cyclase activity
MSNNNYNEQNVAISYYIEEIENQEKEEINIQELMAEMENNEFNNDLTVPKMMNYHENFTVKELLLICDYYGFAKELKTNKCNKDQIIEILVSFESDLNNSDIVFKRQNMWFFINELKNDKFMKKFLLW